ncbi:electron transfer flavoprotein [Leptolyngbya valderiana BDU 20041]|nr:DM13 domain-containing protein [Geitlerinema sp. CS-897]OAB62798.1 electron transfer flavoprotein [Leptolyngbya valderiana BDU 20041]PPT11239.1 hypothetical protein CKA32_002096 [Geitlerinema sp. FC II]
MKSLVFSAISAFIVIAAPVSLPVLAKTSIPEPVSHKQANRSTLRSGTFEAVEHPTQGSARIIVENGRRYLEISRDFRTDEGPDLFVVLHRSTSPGLHFNEGDYLTLGALQSTMGVQRYEIPNNVNLSDYNSAAVWCRQFNATFGAATLNSAM